VSKIFWVIAGTPDSGKTTIAAGLLNALTELGQSSLGFKPFAAQNILSNFDVMQKHTKGRIQGLDPEALLKASSAIDSDDKFDLLEVVNPNNCVYFGKIQSIFMLRTGAPSQGYGQYCHVKNEANVLGRVDVREYLKRKELLDLIIKKPPIDYSFLRAHMLFTENINTSLERLQKYQADVFVIEGASGFMPMWQGSPFPDHIVIVNGGVAELLSGIDPRIQNLQNGQTTPRTQDLYRMGSSTAKESFQVEVPLVTSDEREEAITAVMKDLLIKAGIYD
jgi:hypothetical protein